MFWDSYRLQIHLVFGETMSDNKLFLIGGFPKGYDTPFHPNTLSGKRLLTLKKKHNLWMEFLDLWDTDMEEKAGIISINKLATIEDAKKTHRVIALGKHVWKSIQKCGIEVEYLPHPASRRKIDLQRLERGLIDER